MRYRPLAWLGWGTLLCFAGLPCCPSACQPHPHLQNSSNRVLYIHSHFEHHYKAMHPILHIRDFFTGDILNSLHVGPQLRALRCDFLSFETIYCYVGGSQSHDDWQTRGRIVLWDWQAPPGPNATRVILFKQVGHTHECRYHPNSGARGLFFCLQYTSQRQQKNVWQEVVAIDWTGSVVASSRLSVELPAHLDMKRLPKKIRDNWRKPKKLIDPLHGNSVDPHDGDIVFVNFKNINAMCCLHMAQDRLWVRWCTQPAPRWTHPAQPPHFKYHYKIGTHGTPNFHGIKAYSPAHFTLLHNPFGGSVFFRNVSTGQLIRRDTVVTGCWQGYGGDYKLVTETTALMTCGLNPTPKGSRPINALHYFVSPTSAFSSSPRFREVHQISLRTTSSYATTLWLSRPVVHFRRVRCCGARGCRLDLQLLQCYIRVTGHNATLEARDAAGAVIQNQMVALRPHLLDTMVTVYYCTPPAVLQFVVEGACSAAFAVPALAPSGECREANGTSEHSFCAEGSPQFAAPTPRAWSDCRGLQGGVFQTSD